MDSLKITLSNINTSYKQNMTAQDLEKFMLSGQVQEGFEGQILHLLDETPTPLIAGTIKQISQKKKVQPQKLWKNLAHAAKLVHSSNKFWNEIA